MAREIVFLLVVVLLQGLVITTVVEAAAQQCNTTSDCDFLFQKKGLVCDSDGLCSNPFVGGCLRQKLGETAVPTKRACNSHDNNTNNNDCETSEFDYMEIRIAPGNWESAMIYGWIIQIFLSEMLQVPVSIETSGGEELNFYDPNNGFGFPKIGNNFEGIDKANDVVDCRRVTPDGTNCAHVLPEFWSQLNQDVFDGYEFDSAGNGMVGYLSWYIPSYVVQRDPTLASHYGYKNRTKLAETFQRPTTWGDYCAIVSDNNCTNIEDAFATRAPVTEDEKNSYFDSLDTYKGFFRKTDKGDCSGDKNATCTGHFLDYPCTWNAYTNQQLYWNGIPLESEISYSYGELMQIYQAAEATKSAIILLWWYPDSNIEQYDFWEVKLTGTTRECVNNRAMPPEGKSRCDMNHTANELIGNQVGSCGYQTQTLETVISPSVRINELDKPEGMESPAYNAIRNLLVSDIDISDLLNEWSRVRQANTSGYDLREVVCSFVEENYNVEEEDSSSSSSSTKKKKNMNLNKFIPPSYPRKMDRIPYYSAVNYAAIAFGALAIIIVCLLYAAAFHYRGAKVMKVAQKAYLDLFAFGYLLVCIGAIVSATAPSDVSCIGRQWLITLGYTQGVVPLLVKVAAINRLMQQAKKMRRVQISKTRLFGMVALSTLIITAYLTAWTIVDPPQKVENPSLVSGGGSLVEIRVECGSSSNIWMAIAYLWEAIYIISSAILAFQSRNVRSDFNESKEIANMAYVHFVFFLVRLMVWLLPTSVIHANTQEAISSFLLSLDSVFCITLYFGPKIWRARKETNAPPGTHNRNSTICNFSAAVSSYSQSEHQYSSSHHHHHQYHNNNNSSVFQSCISSNNDSIFEYESQASATEAESSNPVRAAGRRSSFGSLGSVTERATTATTVPEAEESTSCLDAENPPVRNNDNDDDDAKKDAAAKANARRSSSSLETATCHSPDDDSDSTTPTFAEEKINRSFSRAGSGCSATSLASGSYPVTVLDDGDESNSNNKETETSSRDDPPSSELTKLYRRCFYEAESSALSNVLEDMSTHSATDISSISHNNNNNNTADDDDDDDNNMNIIQAAVSDEQQEGIQYIMIRRFEEILMKRKNSLTGEGAVADAVFIDHFGDRGSYTGNMAKNGIPNGYGRMIYDQENRTYEGHWLNGKLHGTGVMNYSNGDVYKGEYCKDLMNGVGIYQWKDGRVYHGEFRDDVREGLGMYSWQDGSRYTGYFREGKMHGYGSFLDHHNNGGKREVGEFVEGRFHRARRVSKSQLAVPESKLGQEILDSLVQEMSVILPNKRVSFC